MLEILALVFLLIVLAWVFVSVAWWLTVGAYVRMRIWLRLRRYVQRSRKRCWMCEHPRRRAGLSDGLCRVCRPIYQAALEVA